MAKKKHSAGKGPTRSNRPVVFFHWRKDKEFTVLEEFVLRVIEEQDALSDKEIADILCLEEEDITVIIEHIETEYPGDIQGDPSRRTLREGFSRKLPDCFAVEIKGDAAPKFDFLDSSGEFADFLAQFKDNIVKPKLAKNQEKFRQDNKAEVYLMDLSFDYNHEPPDFRYGNIPIPEFAHPYLTKLLKKKKKKKS